MMDNKLTILYDTVTGWWKDTGTPDDILHANKLILDSIGTSNQFVLNEDAKVQGNIVIGKNTTISRDSFVTGPAIIGDYCTIGPAARIGPYVSVGNNSSIRNCDVENSILMENCKIEAKIHIKDSIIANGSHIDDNPEPKKHQFLLGERSHVRI
jgi:glucose-1-phosphate thymidylyltransferase